MNSEQNGSALGWRGVFLTIAICLSIVAVSPAVAPSAEAIGPELTVPDPVLSNVRLLLEPAFTLPPWPSDIRMMKLTHAGDGSGRSYVNTQGGQIWEIASDGSVASTP